MTAAELIAKLKALPPESPVFVQGYETGYDDIVDLKSVDVVRYRKAQEWDGEYQEPDQISGKTKSATVIIGQRGHLR